MKYLVVSDNHGDRDILVELVSKYHDSVDFMFHCGDSELDDKDLLWEHFTVVKGNCDYYGQFPERQTIKIGDDTIYMTHGHLSNVRFGLTQLSLEAAQAGANLVFFGHTHQIGCELQEQVLYLNPGSISQPRGTILIPSYALIDSTEQGYDIQYFNRSHRPVDELHFNFPR